GTSPPARGAPARASVVCWAPAKSSRPEHRTGNSAGQSRGRDSRHAQAHLRGYEQLLDVFDGLCVVLVVDRVDARFPRAVHAHALVVEEYRLAGMDVEACADEGDDAGAGPHRPG